MLKTLCAFVLVISAVIQPTWAKADVADTDWVFNPAHSTANCARFEGPKQVSDFKPANLVVSCFFDGQNRWTWTCLINSNDGIGPKLKHFTGKWDAEMQGIDATYKGPEGTFRFELGDCNHKTRHCAMFHIENVRTSRGVGCGDPDRISK